MGLLAGEARGAQPAPVVLVLGWRQLHRAGEQPPAQDLLDRDRPVAQAEPHRRGPAAVSLVERLAPVEPGQQPGGALDHGLEAFRERDGLALVVGAVVAQQQVQAVDGEERVARGAGLEAARALVAGSVPGEATPRRRGGRGVVPAPPERPPGPGARARLRPPGPLLRPPGPARPKALPLRAPR